MHLMLTDEHQKGLSGRIDYKLPESSCKEIESTATLTLNKLYPS